MHSTQAQPQKQQNTAYGKVILAVFLALIVAIAAFAIYKQSIIRQNELRISQLSADIDRLGAQETDLDVRLQISYSLDKVEHEATERLGMVKPNIANVRIISLSGASHVQTAQANDGTVPE